VPRHLIRRVFLEEMAAWTVISVWFAAELALRADQDRAGLRVDEELRHVAPREPVGVGLHDRDHVRRLAIQRHLARPGERRAARLACPRPASDPKALEQLRIGSGHSAEASGRTIAPSPSRGPRRPT
jgi:hypothetical protein